MPRCYFPLFPLILCVAGCNPGPERARAIAEAFAGALSVSLRQDIAPGSKNVATVHHGDRLEILQTKRRFVKVRAPSGIEGWTDVKQLMTPAQMEQLRDFSERIKALPSQGGATAYGTLNIHSEPARQSPTIYQIAEGSSVDVVGHKISSRSAAGTQTPVAVVMASPAPLRTKKADKKEATTPPPPAGPSPKPPANWLELSKTPRIDDSNETDQPKQSAASKTEPKSTVPLHLEDWSLVRTKDGKGGWVLTRMLTMAIPDEVAQYAEGRRIASYFSLGNLDDDGHIKHNWLWTTTTNNPEPYDFDSFRIFIYNLRRHRYETSYIERHVTGYFPVLVTIAADPTFSLVLQDEDDGKIYRKTYIFQVNRVHLLSTEPASRPPEVKPGKAPDKLEFPPPPPEPTDVISKLRQLFKGSK